MSSVARLGGPAWRWELPERRTLSSRDWGRFSTTVYDRGAGEGIWRSSQHRILVGLTPRPPMIVELNGRPVDSPSVGHDALALTFAFYPAKLDVRTVGQSSRYLQICWDDALYAQLAPDLASRPGLSPVLGEDAMLVGLVRALGEELGAGTLDRLLAESLVSAVALRTAQRHGRLPTSVQRAPDLARNRLRRVLDYIEAHLGDELSLVELAEVARINPCHLSKSFKAALGIGLQRYVIQRRIERAKALLTQTGMPLVAIAQDLGFSDQSHFTNVFRREIGTTPARFRAQAAG